MNEDELRKNLNPDEFGQDDLMDALGKGIQDDLEEGQNRVKSVHVASGKKLPQNDVPKPRIPIHPANAQGFARTKVIVVDESTENNLISSAIRKNLEEHVFEDHSNKPHLTPENSYQDGYHIVNVMKEILKDEHVYETMKKYGCCTCDRCQADVLALTLTRLPSKYVVMYKDNVSPMIHFYQSKYKSQIFTEVLKASLDVKEHPRHERKSR